MPSISTFAAAMPVGAAAFVSMPSTRHQRNTVVSKNDLLAETDGDDKDSSGDDDDKE